jgi:membrane protein YdbS with pleckstrin-like domain
METLTAKTKPCPFCAETIQAAAIKCRFCNEFLNSQRAKNLAAGNNGDEDTSPDHILFEARPSLFGMVSAVIKGTLFFALAAFLICYPIEQMPMFQPKEIEQPTELSPEYEAAETVLSESDSAETPPPESDDFGFTENQLNAIAKYRVIAGISLAALVILILLTKMLWLKMMRYEVATDRIEYSRGILDRRVDNIDMFRVIDIQMRRTLLDCIFGIGSVTLITTDKTDPEFKFKKIHGSRRLYDIIKKASLDADRKNSVIHLE